MRKLDIDWGYFYSQHYILFRKSTYDIASMCNCRPATVAYNFHRLGLKTRTATEGRIGTNQSNEWVEKRMIKLRDKIKETGQKISRAKKGVKFTAEHRANIGNARRGEKSTFWKGGVSSINKRIRSGSEFKLWRESVFARDSWTCQECNQRGGRLHPHHIKPFAQFPEDRFDINNGVTLCEKCHKKTDTFGGKSKRRSA